ncbi:MAG TPA: threonine-phosphate decarboxylase [Candidatus Omnitrophica bacterium]|nr:MAG: threonine-phosphate decarboxylase [Omnitrophica WOR_2 bacterium GWA2_63_20]OGX17757.1 MAG: threonine-phosphate decarboxylase [Omnitrophica WOR_2 bacterium GWF2_63_9]OGX30938.1 MAG: threonine-phosphate decarboxylase [Omnitrophica WOR_2 bacterium RIFCSPHIGHO2_12_FULL_64_13]OGX35061.1 MAG: threonine-phosphate decarboxylase [Omnitrophica WOR_2 bacterium RIFCSPHIGHO2_02_FULL_63_39]OGX45660.1 MAG: threonine-phosphate decarboxylase [Omnitrophica WOR_2 bacterium RIFCSPLOWO2_02_FULL_63_16]OGX49
MTLATPTRQRIHGGAAGALLDFSVDVNPFDPPESVRATILSSLEAIRRYPDPQAQRLRQAVADVHHLPMESILPANGSAELIPLLTQALRPRTALVIAPTFTEYEWALDQVGADIRYVVSREADGFCWPETLEGWLPPLDGIDVVWLCNPNNPTGVAVSGERLLALAARCEETRTVLVVDEAFVEWSEAPEQISVADAVPRFTQLIVLRSLTKLFAIPGLRVGYLLASPTLVERLRAHQSAWPLNTFAIDVGAQVVTETAYVARCRRLIRQAVEHCAAGLRGLPGLRPFPSDANFILCKLTTSSLSSSELCARLAQQGCAVRTCDDFTGLEPGRFIRIGVRTPEDNARLIAALHNILATGDAARSHSLRASCEPKANCLSPEAAGEATRQDPWPVKESQNAR